MIIDKRDIFSLERQRSNNIRNSYTSQTDGWQECSKRKAKKVVNPEFFGCATLGSPIYRVQKYLQGPVRSAQSVWQLRTHQTLHGKVPGSRAAQGQWVCQILVRRKRSGPCGREFNDLARATRVSPFYHFSTSHILQETLVFRL